MELSAALAGEHSRGIGLRPEEQVFDAVVGGVVQVCGAAEFVGVRRQGPREIRDVRAVPVDLEPWVQHGVVPIGSDVDQSVAVLELLGVAPLLQFEDDVRRHPCLGVSPGEHDIGPLTRQGQLVLEQHLDIAQPGVEKVIPQHGDAASPGLHLTPRRTRTRPERQLLSQVLGEVGFGPRQVPSGRTIQIHEQIPRQHEDSCGWGSVLKGSPSGRDDPGRVWHTGP